MPSANCFSPMLMFCKATVAGVARLLSVSLTVLLVTVTDAMVKSSGLLAGPGTDVAVGGAAFGAEAAIEGPARPDVLGVAAAMGEGVGPGDVAAAGEGVATGEIGDGVAADEGVATGEGVGDGDAVGDGEGVAAGVEVMVAAGIGFAVAVGLADTVTAGDALEVADATAAGGAAAAIELAASGDAAGLATETA